MSIIPISTTYLMQGSANAKLTLSQLLPSRDIALNEEPGDFEAQVFTTIIHEIAEEAIVHDLVNEDSVTFDVSDGESLTILARQGGVIVATGIFQVCMDVPGAILAPVSTAYLVLTQCEQSLIDCACHEAMQRVFVSQGDGYVAPALETEVAL